ncbi:MAG: hypothetical protein R2778_16050 [Saprospiraceae bacterium]
MLAHETAFIGITQFFRLHLPCIKFSFSALTKSVTGYYNFTQLTKNLAGIFFFLASAERNNLNEYGGYEKQCELYK